MPAAPASISSWRSPAPLHGDARVPCWIKALLVAGLTVVAMAFLDRPIAAWALAARPIAAGGAWHLHSDPIRELAMLEQWGQWVCSVVVITAVLLIDRDGRRRALALALACLVTVLVTYLLKDICGRSRPYVFHDGGWIWGGPRKGFTGGSPWASFPSAHTTGAFALSAGLAWFYPKGRPLFMTLATITAAERVLHSAHFLSDTIAGMGIAVFIVRFILQSKITAQIVCALPNPPSKA